MNISRLDKARRVIMARITKKIGQNHFNRKVKGKNINTEIRTILICRPNHRLGNTLLLTPLLKEVVSIFPKSKIDIIAKGTVCHQIFKGYSNIEKITILPRKPFEELFKYVKKFYSIRSKTYDLVINADGGSSSGKILTYLSKSKFKIYGSLEGQLLEGLSKDFNHMAKKCVYNLRYYLSQIGYKVMPNDIPNLELRLTEDEMKTGKDLLDKTVIDSSKPTISIFTYATGAKCYSKEWWQIFYSKLFYLFNEDYNFLEILPAENVSQIDFSAPHIYSRSVREISSVIANTRLFIGADSGIMHLASASKTPTVGLFFVTKEDEYGPYGNKSISINTNKHTIDETMYIIVKLMDAEVFPKKFSPAT